MPMLSAAPMPIWTLKPRAERRLRGGHPWVFNNELAHRPGQVAPGDPVELHDAAGRFLARGYGHPHTLIAFRALSREAAEEHPWCSAGLLLRLQRAAALRERLGLGAASHRLVFGEADELPGVVLDRYRLHTADGAPAQVLVLQEHTAGAERLHAALLEALQTLVEHEAQRSAQRPMGAAGDAGAAAGWARTALVLRNDVSMRELEGLAKLPPALLHDPAGLDPARARIVLRAAGDPARTIALEADLLAGQKTGFYLDQAANVRMVAQLLAGSLRAGIQAAGPDPAPLRVLDLFAYVGQWGAQLSRVATAAGRAVAVTAVDSSAQALALAEANVRAAGGGWETLRADILRGLDALPARSYDVVVADPPAFIKGRKALPTGRAAYVKLNAMALGLLRPGGLLVTCSCSQLLDEDAFRDVLHHAALRAGVPVRWIARGGQAPDHPLLAAFPEGHYLKCWVGVAD
ncbi:MAG: class I SAM-dependent rRNA methyltransferase [Candidatus Lambdaproteobacteria bacterium]|nr:class I SAM-dependent rRNA methyltransferase [Candidatus Lambdaproteobacteria bacterium]